MSDIDNVIRQTMRNAVHTLGTAVQAVAENLLRRRRETFMLPADGAAGTTIAEGAALMMPVPAHFPDGIRIQSIKVSPRANVAIDGTNNYTDTFSKRDAAGANQATVATISNVATAQTAFVQTTCVLTAANAVLVVGGSLTHTRAKGGTGTQIPAQVCEIVYDVL